MRGVGRAVIAGAIAIAASLLLARVHPFGDAGLFAARSTQVPPLGNTSVPPEVRATLAAKCADCHSNEARAPVYGRLAPMSWMMERDITEGRRAMNLSLWNSYSADLQQTLAAKMVRETKSHEMPLPQYRMIHWNARITEAETVALAQWARGLQAAGAGSVAQFAEDGDPVRGKDIFERRCNGCHALNQNREGPRLKGVYGRNSAAIAGFPYSPSLKNAHIVWNETTLEQWLSDPDRLVPGNNMDFHVARAQERRDVISFLKKGSDQ